MRITRLRSEGELDVAFNTIGSEIVIDLETTGLSPRTDRILELGFGVPGEDQAYICEAPLLPAFARRLHSSGALLVGQNLCFDLKMFLAAGYDFTHREFRDVMLLQHLLDETADYGLEAMVQREYGVSYKTEFWAKYKTYGEAPEHEKDRYTGSDVVYTGLLYRRYTERCRDDALPDRLVRDVHELARELMRTEYEGIPIDLSYLAEKGVELKVKIDDYLPKMRKMTAPQARLVELAKWQTEIAKRKTDKGKQNVPCPGFSFTSNPDLQALFYRELGLPEQKHAKTRAVTVDDSALEALKDRHPVIPMLREYREWNKVYTAYIEGTLERQEGGRIHPSFNVNGTLTGRLSHQNPNLANIPGEGGIKGIYLASPGCKIITSDYKQLEVLLNVHFSKDETLRGMVVDGTSQHDITAKALSLPRPLAKTLNFAMQYRCSAFKVASLLGVPKHEAVEIWNQYWETYKGVKALMDVCDQKIRLGQPIVTPWGRKRRFPFTFEKPWERGKAERQAFNFLIQSTGADCTNVSFYRVNQALRERGWGRALWTVHDSILIEARDEVCEAASSLLKEIMLMPNQELGLDLPLDVDMQPPSVRWVK